MATVSKKDLELFERLTDLALEFHADALDDFVTRCNDRNRDDWENLYEQSDKSLYDPELKELGIKHIVIGKTGLDWFLKKREWRDHALKYENVRKTCYAQMIERQNGGKKVQRLDSVDVGEEHWVMDLFIQQHRKHLIELAKFCRIYVKSKKIRERLAWVFHSNRVLRKCDRYRTALETRKKFESPFKTIADYRKYLRRNLADDLTAGMLSGAPNKFEQQFMFMLYVMIEHEISAPSILEKQRELWHAMINEFEIRARMTGESFEIFMGSENLIFGQQHEK